MHPFEHDILRLAVRNGLFSDHERVVVGVSGGPDSVALLHVLAALRVPLGLDLIVVYVNHGLRPSENSVEEVFVRESTEQLRVVYESAVIEVRKHAERNKLSLEHAARELRYEALRAAAGRRGATAIAVAHTADDQAEEILLRLIRGSGRKGLSGMRLRSRDLVRPFLETEKQTILSYLRDRNISYMQDSSNRDLRFLRNRVRHELLPFLEQTFDPGIRKSLRKTAAIMAEDEELLSRITDRAWDEVVLSVAGDENKAACMIVVDRDIFVRQPLALQRRIIEKLLWRIGGRAVYDHIMKVVDAARLGRTGTELHLSRGLRVGVRRDVLEFSYPRGRSAWRGRLYND